MDEGFIRRIYRTSAWVLLLVVLFTMGLGKFQAAWSIAAGAALSLAVLRGFEWFGRTVFVPGRQLSKWFMLQAALLKLPILTLVIYLVVRSGWFHLAAFAVGVALIQGIIFLKALGLYLIQQEDDRQRRTGETPLKPPGRG